MLKRLLMQAAFNFDRFRPTLTVSLRAGFGVAVQYRTDCACPPGLPRRKRGSQ